MTFFTHKPTEKTIGNLKKDLDELLQAETSLWTLVKSNITKGSIPTIINTMNVLTKEIMDVLSDVEGRKKDSFHTISYKTTQLAQDFKKDLEQLELHLKNQLNQLQETKNISQDKVEEVLNHAKEDDSDISKTSQIIRTLIEKCENEMGELNDNFTYTFKKFDNMITGLNAVKNNPDYILDLKEILKARIVQPDLFDTWLMSGWAVLYERGGSTKFKLIKNTKDKNVNKLLGLEDAHYRGYLEEQDYNSIKVNNNDIFELDGKDMILKKNLDLNQFLAHSFWRCVFDNDENLMKKYFSAYGKDYGLRVYLIDLKNDTTSQWCPLYVVSGYNNSRLNAINDLSGNGHFLSRQPKQ